MLPPLDVSVIISTYNRCTRLDQAIRALSNQTCGTLSFEVIVVDNNSTDETRSSVEKHMSAANSRLRYVFEARQGLSYARNAGIAAARGRITAFSDDDIEVPRDWVRKIKEAFEAYPDAVYLGGRVLPRWEGPLPRWAKPNLAPFALLDLGAVPRYIDARWPQCLVGANLACRREVFRAVGLFDPKTQRVKEGVGSLEDHEWQMRVWAAGLKGIYLPEVFVYSSVSSDRLVKNYHRKWHFGHGSFLSALRDPEFEKAAWRLLDVPAHVYRKIFVHAVNAVKFRLRRAPADAFQQECYSLHCLGFVLHRWRSWMAARAMLKPLPQSSN